MSSSPSRKLVEAIAAASPSRALVERIAAIPNREPLAAAPAPAPARENEAPEETKLQQMQRSELCGPQHENTRTNIEQVDAIMISKFQYIYIYIAVKRSALIIDPCDH